MKPRIPLPKQCPKVFKDKKKYDRKRSKDVSLQQVKDGTSQ